MLAELATRPDEEELAAERRRSQAWRGFGAQQTGQVDKANGRTVDAVGITAGCEARDQAAVRTITRRPWEFWK